MTSKPRYRVDTRGLGFVVLDTRTQSRPKHVSDAHRLKYPPVRFSTVAYYADMAEARTHCSSLNYADLHYTKPKRHAAPILEPDFDDHAWDVT